MDVSLRHWPIFVTGLLLGVAGTMSLGLHRPTQEELATAVLAAAPRPAPASTAAVVLVQAEAEPDSAERADQQMRTAAQAFKAQEAFAAANAPYALAVAQPKPKVRRVVQEPVADAVAAAPSEPATPVRSATSVMGGPGNASDSGEPPVQSE